MVQNGMNQRCTIPSHRPLVHLGAILSDPLLVTHPVWITFWSSSPGHWDIKPPHRSKVVDIRGDQLEKKRSLGLHQSLRQYNAEHTREGIHYRSLEMYQRLAIR